MAEYLSPGVYVEEFDAGIKAMEGVGTSTAGFVGMAQKGPVRGLPVLITSMADYQRRFGGYLPERTYKDMRFLPYAVEQFFNNGGSTCYVMRVCKESALDSNEEETAAEAGSKAGEEPKAGEDAGAETKPKTEGADQTQKEQDDGGALSARGYVKGAGGKNLLSLRAANPGAWGNGIQIRFSLSLKGRTKVTKLPEENQTVYEVQNAEGYQEGDLVCIQYEGQKDSPVYSVVSGIKGNQITLKWAGKPAEDQPAGTGLSAVMYLAEWGVIIQDATASEQYENVSFNPDRNTYVEYALKKSQLASAKADMDNLDENTMKDLLGSGKEPFFDVEFQGGSDGTITFSPDLYRGKDGAPDQRTGLMAFKTLSDVSIMAIPGITDKTVQSDLVSHCEGLTSRFAILDMPLDYKEVSELQEFRENVDSSYAAMYHPWLQCYDSLAARNVFMPPSGAMAGIYGRTDNTRGVHKAPANEVVRNCTGLSVKYNEAEQGKLNPKGINLIRALPGQGIRVWGARTCSSDGNWKYVNVRRLFIFIEESIKANTNWAVFEPNDEMLWSRVEGTIRVFLTTQWRNGALAGSTADEAFFINIGKSTMTQDDILNGRLICIIGVAPVRPAEFVIFRITQKMESAQ